MEKTNRQISRWFSNIVGVVTVVGYAFIIVATIVLLFKSPETLFTLGMGIGAFLGWTMLMGIYTLFCAIFQMMDKQVELPQGVSFKKPKIVWE
jgi:hypothetical protein